MTAPVVPFSPDEDRDRYERNRSRRSRGDAVALRALPHSLEAEEYLLSCCLLDGNGVVAKCVTARIGPESFYDPKHGLVFGVILRLFAESKPIDVAVVAEELKAERQLDAVGGYAFLVQVSGRMPTTATAAQWIEKVREQALLRDLIRSATSVVEECYEFTGGIDAFAGAASQKILAVTGDRSGLPAVTSDAQLDAEVLPAPPMLIDQVMHMGRRTLLLAPSKASKTWTAMHIGAAIASGKPWLGFKTHQAPVLHIDLELPRWGLKERRNKLRELLEIKGTLDIDWWSLDGYQRSIDELLPLITNRAPFGKFGLITIEPAYVILGKRDENDNADVTDFMNRLAWLARMTGAAVLCTHHFAKGDASKKEAKDRGSGAGAWMRAPDTAITLTPLAEDQGEDCYSMEFIERNMKRHAPIGVRFEYPIFRVRGGMDLNALREAGRPRESSAADVVKVLERADGLGLTWSQWQKACERVGMSESTFKRRVKEAEEEGRVTKCGSVYVVRVEGGAPAAA